jgi:hypothetical protein
MIWDACHVSGSDAACISSTLRVQQDDNNNDLSGGAGGASRSTHITTVAMVAEAKSPRLVAYGLIRVS